MNVNDILELEIISNGMDGEGIAREDGKVIFVPYTLAGERVRAVIKSVKKKYALASVIKILRPSSDRVTPECPHYYKCGGCDTAHISNEYRKNIIVQDLKNNLKKIANIEQSAVTFIDHDGVKHARNKLSMPFGYSGGKVVLGLYRQNTHIVEPVECMLAPERASETARTVCAFANEKRLSVYNEKTGEGLLRHLVVREIGNEVSVTLIVNSDGKAVWESELAERLPSSVSFFICPNTRRSNVIMGDTVRLVKGKERLEITASGVRAELSPLAFFQVNDCIRDKLYAAALGAVKSDTLVDLYSGIGITSNIAASMGKTVYAVECVPQAVVDADRTAKLNGNSDRITNTCGKVEDVIRELIAANNLKNIDVLVDPPRKGCGEAVMRAIAEIEPERLIYISCNNATMCRDIKTFNDIRAEYEITDCKIFDMFPCTHHSETLVVLSHEK